MNENESAVPKESIEILGWRRNIQIAVCYGNKLQWKKVYQLLNVECAEILKL